MGDTLKKVKPGDPLVIPAATFNTFIDAAADLAARRHDQRQGARPAVHSGLVLIRNDSGADVARFGVLGISGVVFTPADSLEAFQNQMVLTGVTPATPDHVGRFAVVAEPLASGAIGAACLDGVCPVQVEVAAEADQYADITIGDATKLTSGTSGLAAILYKPAGTGTLWAVVRLGGGGAASAASGLPVKLSAANGNGAYTGREQTWSGSAWGDKSGAADITVYNLFETTGSGMSAIDVTGGPVVLVVDIGGRLWFERETNAHYKT